MLSGPAATVGSPGMKPPCVMPSKPLFAIGANGCVSPRSNDVPNGPGLRSIVTLPISSGVRPKGFFFMRSISRSSAASCARGRGTSTISPSCGSRFWSAENWNAWGATDSPRSGRMLAVLRGRGAAPAAGANAEATASTNVADRRDVRRRFTIGSSRAWGVERRAPTLATSACHVSCPYRARTVPGASGGGFARDCSQAGPRRAVPQRPDVRSARRAFGRA